jgi:streptogramin lyase
VRFKSFLILVAAVAPTLIFSSASGAAVGQVTYFDAGGSPAGIAAGADGNLWFTHTPGSFYQAGHVGRITPSGTLTTYTLGPGSRPAGIVAGSDGNLWFNEPSANRIGYITPTGDVTEFPVTNNGGSGGTFGITLGADDNIWFTSGLANQIGKITPAGDVTFFSSGGATSPDSIASTPTHGLVFTAGNGAVGGTISLSGSTSTFPSYGGNGITSTSDGSVWYAGVTAYGSGSDAIIRLRRGGHEDTDVPTVFPLAAGSQPRGITPGPDGNVWFGDYGRHRVSRISPDGGIVEFNLGLASPSGITAGPDGNIWFADQNLGRIGRVLTGVVPRSKAAPGLTGSAVVGQTLTLSTGTWEYLPTSHAYTWFRCASGVGAACEPIAGETSSTHEVVSADVGSTIRGGVAATNTNGASLVSFSPLSERVRSVTPPVTPPVTLPVTPPVTLPLTPPVTITRGFKPKVSVLNSSIVLRSSYRVSSRGSITQKVSFVRGGKSLSLCTATRAVNVPSTAELTCKSGRSARAYLRRGTLRLTMQTTFRATGQGSKTVVEALTLSRAR